MGGFSSSSSPGRGLAFRFAQTPSWTWLPPPTIRLLVVVVGGVKTGMVVMVRWAAGLSVLLVGVAWLLGERDGVRSLGIRRRWSRVSSSSLSSSEGASKASFKLRSAGVSCCSSRDVRRELFRERKEGGGEVGMVFAVGVIGDSSLSSAATCRMLVLIDVGNVDGKAVFYSR